MASPAASPTRLQPLVDADAIQRRIAELARQIREDYGDDPILFLCILKGSFMFLADLCRHFGDDVRLEFMRVSSYGEETRSSGVVQILQDVDHPLEGKNVLVVEDIVDTGATLRHLRELLALRNPKSLKVVALLNKAAARTVQVDVEYVGFDIPNEFVVGYGLDVAEKYRNLPYVAVLDQERTS